MEPRKIDCLICKADIDNKQMDTKGELVGGKNWEVGIDIYTLLTASIK